MISKGLLEPSAYAITVANENYETLATTPIWILEKGRVVKQLLLTRDFRLVLFNFKAGSVKGDLGQMASRLFIGKGLIFP